MPQFFEVPAWENFGNAQDMVRLDLRAHEWMYVRDYIKMCHEFMGVHCMSQKMCDSLHSFDTALATYGQDKLFDESQKGGKQS